MVDVVRKNFHSVSPRVEKNLSKRSKVGLRRPHIMRGMSAYGFTI